MRARPAPDEPAAALDPSPYRDWDLHCHFGSLDGRTPAEKMANLVAVRMEDPRTRHPRLDLAGVDPSPMADLAARLPGLRLVALNAGPSLGPAAARAFGGSSVAADIATMQGVGGVDRLIAAAGAGRIVFGTHDPMFVPESAVLKLRESAPAPEALDAIGGGNALRLLGAGGP